MFSEQEAVQCGAAVRYPQPALVQILGASRGILDLLAEDEGQLEQEQVPVSALPDQGFGLPD